MPALVLSTVQDYIADARVLLLDKVYPYRYDDNSLLVALNLSIATAARLKPELFLNGIPNYSAVSGQIVPVNMKWRQAISYGTVGHALMRDQEDVQDARATTFFNVQEYILTGVVTRGPVQGGTTPPGNAQR